MKIEFKGSLSPYMLCEIAIWIKENFTDLTIMEVNEEKLFCDCKIIKIKKNVILIEPFKKIKNRK